MRAVFLDRDGTVIVDPPDERVDRLDKIALFPDTMEALALLAGLDYGLILITNQTGIAEGRLDEAGFDAINNKVLEMLAPSGINILRTYVCPHAATDGCACRKPKPTMLLRAAEEFALDLAASWMIGDRQSDILAGAAAGTKTILVQTANTPVTSTTATYTAPSLSDAIRYIAAQ